MAFIILVLNLLTLYPALTLIPLTPGGGTEPCLVALLLGAEESVSSPRGKVLHVPANMVPILSQQPLIVPVHTTRLLGITCFFLRRPFPALLSLRMDSGDT